MDYLQIQWYMLDGLFINCWRKMSTNRFPTVINSKGIKASKVPILDLNMENYYKIDVQMIIKGTKGGFKGSTISSKKEQKQKKTDT